MGSVCYVHRVVSAEGYCYPYKCKVQVPVAVTINMSKCKLQVPVAVTESVCCEHRGLTGRER